MSKLETNTIDNISGSSTLTIGDSNTSTIALKSGATLTNFPDNTPAFKAISNSSQSVTNSANNLCVLGTEIFDTDNAFSSNRFTVPSGEGGKYFFHHRCLVDDLDDGGFIQLNLYKNGSEQGNYLITTRSAHASFTLAVQASGLIDLSAGDYLESYIYQSEAGTQHIESAHSFFAGYKIIE